MIISQFFLRVTKDNKEFKAAEKPEHQVEYSCHQRAASGDKLWMYDYVQLFVGRGLRRQKFKEFFIDLLLGIFRSEQSHTLKSSPLCAPIKIFATKIFLANLT